ncbi:pyridoxal phosphate-dependent aminotransferase [Clostridium fermenticellae]|uniref:cysteine-S-conjugate beta-lyase n=1 Tax=Clostridium fermenticellae TaxID=2068654 RepID=A0A386H1V1_9CLOT|nr:MalY/PatB family protein [Clostridium fermenticellae]AYD39650.1 pyridoxal phosphate-dependent aminotransferase [Clostridium fermenticellae]
MQYNFDEIISRNNSAKYDELSVNYGRDDIIPMWIADMEFRTAQPIIDAMKNKLDEGIFGYVSRPDSYFESVRKWYLKKHNWNIESKYMSHSHGVVPGMVMMIKEFTDPGDKIIIQSPVYNEFFEIIEDSGRKLVISPLKLVNGRYEMDYEDFEEKIKTGVKMFLLCNPHNPVGRVWTKEELTQIGKICLKYNVQVISDEIHCELVYGNNKYIPFASISQKFFQNSITCFAPSKTFNLAGLQSSIIVFGNKGQKDRYDHLLQINDIKRNNSFSLVATEAAYRYGEEWLNQLLAYLKGNIDFVYNYCKENIPKIKPNIPEATYLIWIDCKGLGMTAEELKDFMTNKARLALGLWYGEESKDHVRMNIACPRSVVGEALMRLKSAVDNL